MPDTLEQAREYIRGCPDNAVLAVCSVVRNEGNAAIQFLGKPDLLIWHIEAAVRERKRSGGIEPMSRPSVSDYDFRAWAVARR